MARYVSDEEIEAQIREADAKDAAAEEAAFIAANGGEAPENPENHIYRPSDVGNAERLVHQHGENFRYCYKWQKWLVWDGKRWKPDDMGSMFQFAKRTVADMIAKSFGDESLAKHALRSQRADRLNAMISLARDESPILPDDLDCDPMLLNCANCTVDLRDGTAKPHDPTDHITKISPTIYKADARSDLWDDFLLQIFDCDGKLIDWLQRVCGYALTGSVIEQLLLVFYGTGANGKSTFLEAIMHAMGEDYSMAAAPDFLMAKRGEIHPTERADLKGRRFVSCVETSDSCRLAEPLVKSLTGGDKIRARFMRQDFFEFEPTHKLVLCTNHKPVISGTDYGIWRRLRLVPFNVTVPPEKQDKDLPAKLRRESSAILAWMVKGCLAWQRDGLKPPKSVTEATESYRSDEDIIGRFIDSECTVGNGYRCRASQLFSTYKTWCERNSEASLSQRRFGDAMTEKGYVKSRSNGIWYDGIGVLQND